MNGIQTSVTLSCVIKPMEYYLAETSDTYLNINFFLCANHCGRTDYHRPIIGWCWTSSLETMKCIVVWHSGWPMQKNSHYHTSKWQSMYSNSHSTLYAILICILPTPASSMHVCYRCMCAWMRANICVTSNRPWLLLLCCVPAAAAVHFS